MRVILLSGGLDSALCLWQHGPYDLALGIDYGQPHRMELRRAVDFAGRFRLPFERIECRWQVQPSTGLLGGHDVTAALSVVPGRNTFFVALAAMRGGTDITLGCNADDHDAYMDCRRDVLAAAAAACGVSVRLPLIAMGKADVVLSARAAGVPVEWCLSCYRGTDCRECAACVARRAADAAERESSQLVRQVTRDERTT